MFVFQAKCENCMRHTKPPSLRVHVPDWRVSPLWLCCINDMHKNTLSTRNIYKRPGQVPSGPERSTDWWRLLVCIQAAFHTGDKILLESLRVHSPYCMRRDQPTPKCTCVLKWKYSLTTPLLCSYFSLLLCLFLKLFLVYVFAYLCVPVSLPILQFCSSAPPTLSLITSFTSIVSFSIIPHSFQPPPLLLSFIPPGRATVLSGICWIWWA